MRRWLFNQKQVEALTVPFIIDEQTYRHVSTEPLLVELNKVDRLVEYYSTELIGSVELIQAYKLRAAMLSYSEAYPIATYGDKVKDLCHRVRMLLPPGVSHLWDKL